MQNFQISALQDSEFNELLSYSDATLASHGARWITADESPGYPCRVSLQDAALGERVLAVSYEHHPVNSPYRAAGPIFIREGAVTANPEVNEIPTLFLHRQLSVRAYDSNHMITAASICLGSDLKAELEILLENPSTAYVHVHYAIPGCFGCAVHRV